MTSLTGDNEPLTGSGVARLRGDLTFISEDSEVYGSSAAELVDADNEVGTGLQLPAGVFLSADSLLGQSCAARRAGGASSFARAGRGGLRPSPDRPLASTGSGRADDVTALVPGGMLLAGCEGPRS